MFRAYGEILPQHFPNTSQSVTTLHFSPKGERRGQTILFICFFFMLKNE